MRRFVRNFELRDAKDMPPNVFGIKMLYIIKHFGKQQEGNNCVCVSYLVVAEFGLLKDGKNAQSTSSHTRNAYMAI